MTSETNRGSQTRFVFKLAPFLGISHLIREGKRSEVDPAALAEEIREHGIDKMPEEVVSFLFDHLEGKIERRGRKGLSPTEKTLLARHAALLYRGVRDAQQDAPDAVPELVDFLNEMAPEFDHPMADSEAAWRIVSILLRGHDGHHRKFANLVSEYAPLSE